MANMDIHGRYTPKTGAIKFFCNGWIEGGFVPSGEHKGMIWIKFQVEDCNDTYYGCIDPDADPYASPPTHHFTIAVPEECCAGSPCLQGETGYNCDGPTPSEIRVAFGGISLPPPYTRNLEDIIPCDGCHTYYESQSFKYEYKVNFNDIFLFHQHSGEDPCLWWSGWLPYTMARHWWYNNGDCSGPEDYIEYLDTTIRVIPCGVIERADTSERWLFRNLFAESYPPCAEYAWKMPCFDSSKIYNNILTACNYDICAENPDWPLGYGGQAQIIES